MDGGLEKWSGYKDFGSAMESQVMLLGSSLMTSHFAREYDALLDSL